MAASRSRLPLSHRLSGFVSRRAGAVVLGAALVTATLAVPLLAWPPDEFASQEPGGAVFDARDGVNERFGAGVATWFFIVEAADGDVLDRDGLLAIHERAQAVRDSAQFGPLLVRRSDPVTGGELDGVVSLADAVDAALAAHGLGGLTAADDEAVRTVASRIIDAEGPAAVGVSQAASHDDATGWWSAPALTLSVVADSAMIEGSGRDAGFGSDVAVEEVGRQVLALLRDADGVVVHPVAVDLTLTSQEQGQAAGPFIGFTVLAIVLLVGVTFRSYWTLAVVGGALVALLVWLQGLANLIGLKEDQILSTVVPIAMIAFGVDYAFHAVGRYREERGSGPPRRALASGLGGVAPALLLALATGALAFLASTASGIESIVQFGIAAALALASAFVVLGVVVPAAVALIDERVGRSTGRELGSGVRRWRRVLAALAGAVAAATAMTAVLFVVFLSPPVGLALLASYLLVFVIVPAWVAGRVAWPAARTNAADSALAGRRVGALLGRVVTVVAARRAVALPAIGLLSAVAAFYAVQVPASFDVEDFFAADTDFVVGLDKLDEHVGDQGGEPAVVFVSTDVSDDRAVAALEAFADRLAALDTDLLAHAADGSVIVDRRALDVLDGSATLTAVERAQVLAPPNGEGLAALQLSVGLIGSRAQEKVEAVRDLLEPLVSDLEADLGALHPHAQATLTGTPLVRLASLEGVSRALQVSLPIAVLLCLGCAWAFMRSLRYALAATVPILLVVTWLYGFMSLAGFSVNLVTATIGAISIGIGIDFATHMTMRYREHLVPGSSRLAALHAAATSTGVALAGSALTSVAGFAILAFAPMPMFASFGLLTTAMIVLALAASLLVLPGLLMLVTREPQPLPADNRALPHVGPEPVSSSSSPG